MITLYSKDFETEYGVITSLCEAFVEEERNGLFELSFVMLNTDSLFNYVKEENIVVANANDTLLNQKFRIYMTRKLMNNRVEVFARHISFDLMYDYIDNVSFENQSCEYALNQLFRNSNFSKHYKGYSDIINAQDYSMSMANVLEAIVGKQGSIIDTFGTGAELLRDNENIHVLNRRGHDNDVTIEYRKNLTGFELEEDTTEVVTKIYPYAYYEKKDNKIEIRGGGYKDIYLENSYSRNKAEISNLVGNTILVDSNFTPTTPGADAMFYSTFEMFKTVDDDYKISITSRDKKNKSRKSFIKIKEPLRGIEDIKDIILTTEEGVRIRRKLNQKRLLKGHISKIMKQGDYKGICIKKSNLSKNALETRSAKVLNDKFIYSDRDAIDSLNNNKFYQQQQWWIFVFHKNVSDEQAIAMVCESTLLFELNEYEYDSTKSFDFEILDNSYLDLMVGSIPSLAPESIEFTYSTLEKITCDNKYVDSPLASIYATPRIRSIDYSDRFKETKPTPSELIKLANDEFRVRGLDKPKMNFKLDFIPLSKCVGYEGLEDKISLCDNVTIIDTRYNINTQAKVIKTIFNVLKNRYESVELGNFRTFLGDIISAEDGKDGQNGKDGKDGADGKDGQDANINDFIDEVPLKSIVSTKLYGFSSIEISWTFENKVYYTYELYASKTQGFTPNTFDLIHSGKSSSFLFQAQPNETWYFRVCAVNTHGNRSEFSDEVSVTTVKINDLSNYVDNMAIGDALIGTLSLDRGWVGTLRGNYIDAKQLSVTDGNGKRTLDIDSFGNVNIDSTSIRLASDGVLDIDTSNYYLNNTEMIFRRDGKKTFGIKRGYSHLYNPTDNTLMGAMIPRSTVGGQYYDNGISTVASENCYYYSIARASDWSNDEQVTFSPTEYFVINFRDRGSQKMGLNLYTPFYAHDGINMSKKSITNADTITSNNISTLSFRHPNGNEMFSNDGYTVSNRRGWYWNGNNLLDPVIIGGSYGYNISPSTNTYRSSVNLDGILDKINIYPTQSTYRTNSERSLEIDVTELRESENADMFIKRHDTVNSETGESEIVENIDMKSMLHLALLEIKKLKEEIQTIKGGVINAQKID